MKTTKMPKEKKNLASDTEVPLHSSGSSSLLKAKSYLTKPSQSNYFKWIFLYLCFFNKVMAMFFMQVGNSLLDLDLLLSF